MRSTSSSEARPSAVTSGQRARNFSKYGPTVLTPVCCSMISDSQTRYGSARSPAGGRHGNRRRWRSYQSSSSEGRETLRSAGTTSRLILAAAEELITTLYRQNANLSTSCPGLSRASTSFLGGSKDVDGRAQ